VAMMVGVLSTVVVVGFVVIALNETLAKTNPITVAKSLPAEANASTRVVEGVTYKVVRPHGDPQVANGTYLVDDAGTVHYKYEEGIGGKEIAAPQARLMSLVIDGILTRQLPWGLVLIGVFISVLMEVVGVPALAFAVGVYLPLESTTPVFLGGLVRLLIDRQRGGAAESDSGPGVLFASGLIGGASLMGLAYAGLQYDKASVVKVKNFFDLSRHLPDWSTHGPWVGLLTFAFVAYLLWRAARSGEGAIAQPHA
jgi:OPT oligopeptide transporter protein